MVLNPVHPKENFVDRWATPEGKELRLKENFQLWVRQAVRDFEKIRSLDGQSLIDHLKDVLGVNVSLKQVGAPVVGSAASTPAPAIVVTEAPRPWSGRG